MSSLRVLTSRGSCQWKARAKHFSKSFLLATDQQQQQHVSPTRHLMRCFSQIVHSASPPSFDSKVGFNDYEKGHAEFRPSLPRFYNFADVLDEWARKEEVRYSNTCNHVTNTY